jgi:hypothetical protein
MMHKTSRMLGRASACSDAVSKRLRVDYGKESYGESVR